MEFVLLLGAVALTALFVHLTRRVPLLALTVTVGGSYLAWNAMNALPADPYEFFGATFAFDPIIKFLLLVAFAVNALLAVVALFNPDTREYVSFLYWCWLPWLVAVSIDSFPLAILAWAFGLYVLALTLAPKRAGQVGGAAHYLLVILLSLAGLLLANRFFELYPLTPEQTNLIQTGVLFLAWSFGLALAVVPFHIWLTALAEEAAPVYLVALTSWGLPLGVWFLFGLLRRYLWLSEKSNLLSLILIAGLATAIVGGLSAALERRGTRILAFASLLTFGFVLIDLGRARYDLLLNTGLALVGRGLALALFATGLALFRATNQSWARACALGALVLGGAGLTGLPLTPLFVSNLPIWSEYAVTDTRLFVLLLLAAFGMWVGVARVLSPMVFEWRVDAERQEANAMKESAPLVERVESAEEENVVQAQEPIQVGQLVNSSVGAEASEVTKASDERVEKSPAVPPVATNEIPSSAEPAEVSKEQAIVESKSDEEYDPVQAMREVFAKVLAWLRAIAAHSPRLAHGLLYIAVNWQAFVGVAVVLVLVAALLVAGIFPKLILDSLASALGKPDYLK